MAYMKSTLISRPVESPFAGVAEALGVDWGAVSSVGSGVLNFFGQGIKAQGAQEALAAQMKADADARAAAAARSGGGVSTTALLVGGAVLAGVLVFAMRRK